MLLTVLVILCALALLLVFLMLPGESMLDKRRPFWGVNFAHRGLHTQDKSVPENSLLAFTKAVEAGYGIELDLQLSSDGEVMVFHDDDVKRVCGVEGRLDSFSYDELRAMRLHHTNQRIPTLREVLALVGGAVPLIIELKRSARNDQLCQESWKILRTYDGDFCIESFDPRMVRWYKKHVPGILRGQLAAPPKELNSGAAGVLVGLGLANFLGRPQFIAYQNGPKPISIALEERFAMRVVWTARDAKTAPRLEEENDAVIFEYYTPEPRFKQPPSEEPELPDDAFVFPEEITEKDITETLLLDEDEDTVPPEETVPEGTVPSTEAPPEEPAPKKSPLSEETSPPEPPPAKAPPKAKAPPPKGKKNPPPDDTLKDKP